MKENYTPAEENLFEKEVVKLLVENDLRSKYTQILKDKYQVSRIKDRITKFSFYFTRVAAMAVLIASSFLIISQLGKPKARQLAYELAQETNILGNQEVMRNNKNTTDDMRLRANEAFVNKKYNEAIVHYEKLNSLGLAKDLDYFYQAISNLKSTKPNAMIALTLLNKLPSSLGIDQEVMWFKALAYAGLKDNENAKKLLVEIIATDKYKVEEAKKLLNVLQ